MRERHWHARQAGFVSGIAYRVVPGDKAPGDLRLELRLDGAWRAVSMELTFLTADFFSENEDAIRQHRPYWRRSGQGYFMDRVYRAVREGWEPVASELREQRQRAALR